MSKTNHKEKNGCGLLFQQSCLLKRHLGQVINIQVSNNKTATLRELYIIRFMRHNTF